MLGLLVLQVQWLDSFITETKVKIDIFINLKEEANEMTKIANINQSHKSHREYK
jgi:hypothetical protein